MGILERLCATRSRRRIGQRIAESRGRLFRIAFAWCGDRMVADDLVQETLERALQHQEDLRDPDRLDAWLHSILHNCWRQYLRRQRPDVELDESVLDPRGDVAGDVERLQRIEAMRRAILSLPVLQREVVTLIDIEGFAYAEAAEILNVPVGTVMSRLNRARQGLCRRLAAWQEPAQAAPSDAPASPRAMPRLVRSRR